VDRGPSIDSLEAIETCFARLHRSATEVFKIRRPVRLRLGDEWVDLSTPESRRAACREEERVGRALAHDVVLGVVPITPGSDGRLRAGGRGPAVDWALRMRRLAETERADERLAAGTLDDERLAAVARRLAAFHEKARGAAGTSEDRVLEALRRRIRLRIDAPGWPRRTPLPEEVERIEAWQLDFLDAQAERFAKRAATDAIRQGHGELGLEHVFVDASGEVRILAGLEVGPRFRHADVVADVAGLASELAARHRVDLAERFVADYARIANDFELYPLLDFHSSRRAAIRG
jgi:aminoglycoside phosphotransferase family enzyme